MDLEMNLETTVETGAETEQNSGAEQTTYTQADIDRRVQQALQTQERKMLARFKQEQTEAQKLSSMNETQRKEYEFEQKKKELEEKEKQFNLMSNKMEATKVMASRGVPVDFVDYIVDESADVMMARIDTFDKQFKAAVADAVNKKIASPAPKASGVTQTGLTKEQFSKMSIAQQSELYRTNPTLYKELAIMG